MGEKKYILTKRQLEDLVESDMEFEALKDTGVDNWAYYGEHCKGEFGYDEEADCWVPDLSKYEEFKEGEK